MTLYEMAGSQTNRSPVIADSETGGEQGRLQNRLTVDVADDPLSRDVYGIMGVPIDVTSLPAVLAQLRRAAEAKKPFVLSTPNLNFLVLSRFDASFRESLLMSDLCPADGMAIVWLGRILGVPLPARIAGSDIFDAIRSDHESTTPINVFLFGGADGLANFVAEKINSTSTGMKCVGALSPGFGTVEQMSAPELLKEINASKADFVAAFLGARKGQEWLARNHHEISVPIRAHLGATLNYQAATIKRAPERWQAWGLEWLWRIKEEPYLWQRYLRDGLALMRILLTSVAPLIVHEFARKRTGSTGKDVHISHREEGHRTMVFIRGAAVAENVAEISSYLRVVISDKRNVVIDLSRATSIDARILGLLIMVRKVQRQNGFQFGVDCQNRLLKRIIALRGFGYLLTKPTYAARVS